MTSDASTLRRQCRDCGVPFEVTPQEQDVLRAKAAEHGWNYHAPRRCYSCRLAKRRAETIFREPTAEPIQLVCGVCRQPFVFHVRDQEYFAARGYSIPHRCATCRPRGGRRTRE